MAWQVSRLSSRFCKRHNRSSLKHPGFASLSRSYDNGNHGGSLSLLSKIDVVSKPTSIKFFPSTPCHARVPEDRKKFCNSYSLVNTPSILANRSSITRAHSPARGYLTCPCVLRTIAGPYSAPSASNLSTKSIQNFCSVNRSTSHSLDSFQELPVVGNTGGEKVEADILLTQDGQVLFSGLKSSELVSTLLNLQLVSYEPLVDLSIKVLKSPLMNFALFKQPLLAIVKRTVYSHFCAGEDVAEASKTLKRMWELGLTSILDYSLEDAMDNSSCDNNLKGFLQTIEQAKQLPTGSVSFSCVKMTALCPLPLLERISSLLRWEHMHRGFKLPWREDVLPLFVDESPMYHIQCQPETLTDEEEQDLHLAKDRLWKLCQACNAASLPLLIDAEYTSAQPAIDYYTYIAASEFNRNGIPFVYGTVQAYLKDSLSRLSLAANEATRRRVSFGVKLVRGAYLTRESSLAASHGVESPIHSCIEKTHECYDRCAAFMMERAVNAQGAVVLATHNFDSGRIAAVRAESLGLLKGNPRLQFAQLKGMADGLSLALVRAGFQVSKYLPFGPVEHVMPYLIRRAEENRGLLGNTLADRIRIRQEIKRRIFYT